MVVIGCDHAGVEQAEMFYHYLADDEGAYWVGTFKENPPVDYPDIVSKIVRQIENDYEAENYSFVLLLCGSGIGMSMCANRLGFRAVQAIEPFQAELARAHNGANCLCLDARHIDFGKNVEIMEAFRQTPHPTEERHIKRIEKMMRL